MGVHRIAVVRGAHRHRRLRVATVLDETIAMPRLVHPPSRAGSPAYESISERLLLGRVRRYLPALRGHEHDIGYSSPASPPRPMRGSGPVRFSWVFLLQAMRLRRWTSTRSCPVVFDAGATRTYLHGPGVWGHRPLAPAVFDRILSTMAQGRVRAGKADRRGMEERMTRRIQLEFADGGVQAIAELLEDDAPAVCAALWQALEVELVAKATHAMASGQEIMINLPENNRRFDPTTVPTQNATIYPAAGDILWAWLPAHYMKEYRDGLWDFIVVYGQCVLTSRETGPLVCSRWAHISEGLEAFAAESARLNTEGQMVLRVTRLPD